ncbi:MAG: ribonuclease R [Chromatiales bacterium]
MSKDNIKDRVAGQDPYQKREAKKYENPIASREYILEQMELTGQSMNFADILKMLAIDDDDRRVAVQRRLNAMVRDGQLIRNREGFFSPVSPDDLIAGKVIGHQDGFGFLKPDAGGNDLFLSPYQMRGVLHGDRALALITGVDRRGRSEGTIIKVLERANQTIVGRLFCDEGEVFVVPDNKRISQEIRIPDMDCDQGGMGEIVNIEVTEQPTSRHRGLGKVIEVLGQHMAPGMETDVAIRSHAIPVEWPEELLEEIASLTPEVPEKAKEGRTDLRKIPLVTIDGADARDFDDAVYANKTPKGWRLLVCIADVSSYVKPGTALDQEAYKRGNSVYFPNRVVPMLPEVLSNGLCSLNPDVDRLCMTAELNIDDDGNIFRSKFYPAVMRSHARLIYDDVAAMLVDGDEALCAKHEKILPHLHELYALYKVLHKGRQRVGAIDFDTTETRIVFCADKKIDRVEPVIRNDAHRLIEECMLAANVAAARLLLRRQIPALYRNHEPPPPDKIVDLRAFLSELGIILDGGNKPTAKHFASLLEDVRERPDAHLIQTVLLRSMSQAFYSSENLGHFGLSFPAYAHFTSPIRRYPDLMVHRAIMHSLTNKDAASFAFSATQLQTYGEHCSGTERRADEATRDVLDWLKCEFMMDKIGDEFHGIISSVTSFGLFVQLDHIYVDGLVHISALKNDYYHFDPVGHRLSGERSGQVFRLGDPIRIKVAAVNLDDRKIDFVLADGWVAPQSKRDQRFAASGKRKKDDSRPPRPGKKDKNKSDDSKKRKKRGKRSRRK